MTLSVLPFFAACEGDIFYDSQPCLVIEGWIARDETPKVLLTTSINVDEAYSEYDRIDQKCVVRDAEVSILSEGKQYRLYGQSDSTDLVSYFYTTGNFVGETGKQYTVRVNYKQWEINADAVVPSSHGIDSIRISEIDGTGKYAINVLVKNMTPSEYGRFFIRSSSDRYQDFLLVEDSGLDGEHWSKDEKWVTLFRPQIQYKNNSSYFDSGELVEIQFRTMNKDLFYWWEEYETRLNLSRNPLMPLSSNFFNKDGVYGYWGGYGVSSATIKIP
ncbi:MAG: DUF4249 domain-containing protein [Bacteroidales bacterium]|nr:DUF4249 domain-containing protein [Bacteroidales bacterium]